MPSTITPITVREFYDDAHPPPKNSENAFFSILAGQRLSLGVGKVVRLFIRSDVGNPARSSAPAYLLLAPVLGPVVDVRETKKGVEYVVKNEFEGTQISFAYLRDANAWCPPTSPELARELSERICLTATAENWVWHEGERVPAFLTPEAPELKPLAAPRPPKRTRAHMLNGTVPDEGALCPTRRLYEPTVPSPLKENGASEMEE